MEVEMVWNRTYSGLILLPTFKERYEYLALNSKIGEATFGAERMFNQIFYKDQSWRHIRADIILRDQGRDLGMPDEEYEIFGKVIVHHIDPITMEDIVDRSDKLFDPENLITCSLQTHNAIHYGDISVLPVYKIVERKPFDTCPWR